MSESQQSVRVQANYAISDVEMSQASDEKFVAYIRERIERNFAEELAKCLGSVGPAIVGRVHDIEETDADIWRGMGLNHTFTRYADVFPIAPPPITPDAPTPADATYLRVSMRWFK